MEVRAVWRARVTLFASIALQDCVGVGMLVVPEVRGGGAIQAAQHGQEGGCVWVGCNRRQHGMAGDMIIRSHAIDAQDRCAGGLAPLLRGGVGLRLRRPLWC